MRAAAAGKSSLAQIVRSSVNGGVDLLLVGQPADPAIENAGIYVNAAVVQGIDSGDIATDTVKKSWQRVMALKAKLQSMQTEFGSH
jgi:hypothetical protein